MKRGFSVFRLVVCLILCVSLIFGTFRPKAEAVLLESALGVGVAACLILMSAGVVFNPQTQEDIKAIGNSFQTYMYQWGTEAEKLDEVEEWFSGLSVLDPSDDDGWESPNDTKIKLARGILAGISAWIASVVLGRIEIEDTISPIPVGFSYVNLGTSRFGYEYMATGAVSYFLNDSAEVIQLIHDAYENRLAIVFCGNNSSLFGFYWTDEGYFSTGKWNNPDGVIHSSDFGVYPLDSLVLTASHGAGFSLYDSYIYFSKSVCESKSDFLTSDYLAVDWDGDLVSAWSSSYEFPVFVKKSVNTTWNSSISTVTSWYSNIRPETVYCPASEDDVVWSYSTIEPSTYVGDIPSDLQAGNLSEEEIPLVDIDYSQVLPVGQTYLESIQSLAGQLESGDMTYEDYLDITSVKAEQPVFTTNIPYGSEVTYTQGEAADPITVEATVSDGGTLTYSWYRYGVDADGSVYPVEVLGTGNTFTPSTEELGTSYYYCRVDNDCDGYWNFAQSSSIAVHVVAEESTGPGTGSDTGSDTDTDVVDKLGDAVSDALSDAAANEQHQAQQTGSDVSQQLMDSVPDYSTRFLPAVKNLSDALGYTGTSCVLTMPAITIPAVGSLFSETPLLAEQSINFEDYFEKMPELLMTIIRALFDLTVVLFCLREFTDTVAEALTGFKVKDIKGGDD